MIKFCKFQINDILLKDVCEACEHFEWRFIYYVPFEALLNQNIYFKFCDKIQNDIKIYLVKNRLRNKRIRNPHLFIVTSTDLSGFNGYTSESNEKLATAFPYLSFILNSNSSITFINVAENLPVPLDYIKSKIKEKIMLIKKGYAQGFIDNRYEYIRLNLNLQGKNKLDESYTSSGAHGRHITPFIYSNELKIHKEIKINSDLKFFFNTDSEGKKDVEGLKLRILLIDDKIGDPENCKATLVKNLLKMNFDNAKHNDVCWDTQIEAAIFPFDNFDFKNSINEYSGRLRHKESNKEQITSEYELKIEKYDTGSIEKFIDENKSKIQIIAVKTLDLARQLLACNHLRFDLIMMDYLLAEKPDNSGEREYATEFWGDGTEKYFEFSEDAKKKDSNYSEFVEIYKKIKANRGPMQRLWIFPITAFNQTFIDDLRNRGVRLIDYYWYLSRGADPINTPYLFIYSLNKFLQLMLDQAIFSTDDIIEFLDRSVSKYEEFKKHEDSKENKQRSKKDHLLTEEKIQRMKALFSTEYTYFMNKFAVEDQIARDREYGSLFAQYVYDNFILKNGPLLEISRAIRRLYHSLAFGEKRDYLKTLERLYRMLDLFRMKLFEDKHPGDAKPEESDIDKWEIKFNEIITERFS